jgi:hypothetical protein
MMAGREGEILALVAEMDVLGQAIVASIGDPGALLAHTRKREACLERVARLMPSAGPLPATAMLRLAAVALQTRDLAREVASQRDRVAIRLARLRQGRRMGAAYRRGTG